MLEMIMRIDELAKGNRVLSEQTSKTLLLMLEQVVEQTADDAVVEEVVEDTTATEEVEATE